jgi:hypothetical protein
MRTAEVRFTPMNGHRQTGPTGPFRAKLGHDANKKALKEKPPRRRLFNTGRCGVGQRFSHVYSRPTQPLQDNQRDRRNERPDHITEFVCEDCGDHVHVFGHYYGLPVHSTCPLHPRTSDMPEHIIKGHLRGDT